MAPRTARNSAVLMVAAGSETLPHTQWWALSERTLASNPLRNTAKTTLSVKNAAAELVGGRRGGLEVPSLAAVAGVLGRLARDSSTGKFWPRFRIRRQSAISSGQTRQVVNDSARSASVLGGAVANAGASVPLNEHASSSEGSVSCAKLPRRVEGRCQGLECCYMTALVCIQRHVE